MKERVAILGASDDPTRYRAENEVVTWGERDPIVRFRRYLEGRGLWDAAQEEAANAEAAARIGEAIRAAEAKPQPALETMFDHVYAELPWHLQEQKRWLLESGGPEGPAEGKFPL